VTNKFDKLNFEILFFLYNIFFCFFTLYILLYAGSYLNDASIPDTLKWKDHVLIKSPNWYDAIFILIIAVESLLFMLLLFAINKAFLKKTKIRNSYKASGKTTTLIVSIIPFLFIVICIVVLIVESRSPF
jgi:hypothetical protein